MKDHFFKVDARTVLTLGRESIKDHTTAILELVKNSYDAGATEVEVEISVSSANSNARSIRIADNGSGMTLADIDAAWLRIGFSSKRTTTSVRGRRKAGEKGIGRLSADRLGASLELRTVSRGAQPLRVAVDWDAFDTPGRDLGEIPVFVEHPASPPLIPTRGKSPTGGGKPKNEAETGTEIIIQNLRQTWSKSDLEDLRDELSILTPPSSTVPDFRVSLACDLDGFDSGVVSSRMDEVSAIELVCTLAAGTVSYTLTERMTGSKPERGKISWTQFTQKRPTDANPRLSPTLGSVTILLHFFPRTSEILRGTQLSLRDLREFLDRHAGIRVYRDNIRVKPYGNAKSPDADWLGLSERKTRDPAGRGRSTFKVAANQVVGSVLIGRDDNPLLTDSSSREGLVHNDAFQELQSFALGAVRLLESHYHESAAAQHPKVPAKKSPGATIRDIKTSLADAEKKLKHAASMIAQSPERAARAFERSIPSIEGISEQVRVVQESVDELESQARSYRGLATVGIAAAVFGHETQTSIGMVVSASQTARKLLQKRPEQVDTAIEELEKTIRNAERVGAWGKFALARVRKDKRKRKKTAIHSLLLSLVTELRPVFSSSGIELLHSLQEVTASVYGMDIEAIAINLMTNAYAACQMSARRRVIRIDFRESVVAGRTGFLLSVADSGPGVAQKFRERIWEPLFTTKSSDGGTQGSGTGMGLSIVQSIVDELDGTRTVATDKELRGAVFSVWIPVD